MKRKLLFAAMLIAGAFGLKVHAQQWLASAPQDGGTYYLYNVGANAYLSNGYYGEASLKTKGGIAVTLHQNGDAYDIYTSSVYNGSYMVENVSSHWVFLDVALGSYAYYQPWYFVPVDGKPDTYLLRTSGRYLTIFQGSNERGIIVGGIAKNSPIFLNAESNTHKGGNRHTTAKIIRIANISA